MVSLPQAVLKQLTLCLCELFTFLSPGPPGDPGPDDLVVLKGGRGPFGAPGDSGIKGPPGNTWKLLVSMHEESKHTQELSSRLNFFHRASLHKQELCSCEISSNLPCVE